MSIYYDETRNSFIFKNGGTEMNNEYTRWSEFMRQVYRIDDSTTQLKLYNQMKDWERHYTGIDYTKYSHGRLYGNDIQKVIFNNPATIVFWKDGTKTVVKCGPDDTYDAEKGLAMAICKKVYGNENFFHKIFKRWMPKEGPKISVNDAAFNIGISATDAVYNFSKFVDSVYNRIWGNTKEDEK